MFLVESSYLLSNKQFYFSLEYSEKLNILAIHFYVSSFINTISDYFLKALHLLNTIPNQWKDLSPENWILNEFWNSDFLVNVWLKSKYVCVYIYIFSLFVKYY